MVAKRSGKLPAPLALSLIDELDRNPWLRELALGEWTGGEPSGTGEGSASEEFLRRKPGWEERLALITEEAQRTLEENSSRRLEVELRAAREEIQSLRRQLRQADRPPAPNAPKKPRPTEGERHREKLKATLSSTEKALAASETAREKLLSEVALLQQRLEDLLRRRAARSAPPTPLPGGLRREPVELARDLDARLQALSVSPIGTTTPPIQTGMDRPEPFSIPTGIRPDSAAAIDWLLSYPHPLTVAVDGWNLAFQFKNPPGKKERGRVEAAVGRLSHKAAGKRRLLVLFDSRFDLAGAHPGTHPNVEVRFPASADEFLIELARAEPSLVVITSDRRVREEAERFGAIGLWGEALVDWLR